MYRKHYPKVVTHLTATIIAVALSMGIANGQTKMRSVEVTQSVKNSQVTRDIKLTGSVTSPRSANLSSKMAGLVTALNVDAGSEVKQGDVLLQLDSKLAKLDLLLIETEIDQAEIQLKDAERLVNEVNRIAKSGAFAASEADSRKTSLRVAEAEIKKLDARKAQLEELIDRHQLIAPFDGIVSRKLSEVGEWVTTGDSVLELIEMKNLRFDIQIPQEFLAMVKDTGTISVTLDAYPKRKFKADVAVIVPVKNNVSRTFLTRLSLDNPDDLATPGMSGVATIESKSKSDSVVEVPRDALVRFPDGSVKVWVVKGLGSDAKVVSRVVKTAGELGKIAKITEGLDGGETVVFKGNEGLREDQPVRILSSEPATQRTP